MKLDIKIFRYLTPDDWRVLTAVEMGSKNHEVVPTSLIIQLAGLRTGGNAVQKCISTLAKADLISRVRNIKYDGYRLTYGGYDYLALHAHTKAEAILHLGSQMGVGKESDIYLVTAPASTASDTGLEKANVKPVQSILKIHRLGRTSFRSLARNRAYHRHRQHCSWQYLSRLSAQKEFAAMRALYHAGFPVPRPIAWNRHTIVMSLVPGLPLKDVPLSAFGTNINEQREAEGTETPEINATERDEAVAALYSSCIDLSLQLASHGLIHGDLNEFNILVENVPGAFETETTTNTSSDSTNKSQTLSETSQRHQPEMTPYLIDFPQITSLSHPSAEEFFARDITGIKSFFRKRYHFESEDSGPTFADAVARLRSADAARTEPRLDVEIEAAGFSKKMNKDLELYFADEHTGEGEEYDGDDFQAEDLDIADNDQNSHFPSHSPDVNDKENAQDNVSQNSTHDPPLLGGAEDGSHPAVKSQADVGQYNTADKLASLSLHSSQTQGRRTKASAGWSI